MMTTQGQAVAETPAARLTVLRGTCMGAAVLLILQFAIGMGLNLYVEVPSGKSFFAAVFSSALLASHFIVALALLGASVTALVRAIRARAAVVPAAAGTAVIVVAAGAGGTFVNSGSDVASLVMALAAAVGMFCYATAIFRLR
ncbi:MAG: hypothetical protein LBV34_20980 [Nocardiopsaceae bacterium]|jgi:hypothetical protein|nr:hypothetical protein [Nocardiopsaceae bacterium]